MDYLAKIKSFAAGAAEVIGKKSKEVYGVTKVKLEITENQGKVKELYKQIGFDAYKAYRENENILEKIAPVFSEIDALEEKIASLREKAETIKNADASEEMEIIEESAEPTDDTQTVDFE